MSVWWNLTLSIHLHSDCMLLCKIIVSEQFLMHGIWYFGTCSIQWFKRVLLFFFLYVRKPPDLEATWSKALLCMPSVNQTVPVQPIRLYHSEIQFWPHSSEKSRKSCLAVVSFLQHVVGHWQSQISHVMTLEVCSTSVAKTLSTWSLQILALPWWQGRFFLLQSALIPNPK